MEAAIDWLREKGLASAQKKAGRIAAEGIVATIRYGVNDCLKCFGLTPLRAPQPRQHSRKLPLRPLPVPGLPLLRRQPSWIPEALRL